MSSWLRPLELRPRDLEESVLIGVDECHPPPREGQYSPPFVYAASVKTPDQQKLRIKDIMSKGRFFSDSPSVGKEDRRKKVKRAHAFLKSIGHFRFAVVEVSGCSFRDARIETLAHLIYATTGFVQQRYAPMTKKNGVIVVVDGDPFWHRTDRDIVERLAECEEERGNLETTSRVFFRPGADNYCYPVRIADAAAYALSVIRAANPRGKWPYRRLMAHGPGNNGYCLAAVPHRLPSPIIGADNLL